MQTTKQQASLTNSLSIEDYLQQLVDNSSHLNHISETLRKACEYTWQCQTITSHLPSGLDVALLLSKLSADETTLTVCLLSDSRLRSAEHQQLIKKEFGDEILTMVMGLEKLHGFKVTQENNQTNNKEQTERLRRMLLAMVDDVRVVLIKLAFRVQRLRELARDAADNDNEEFEKISRSLAAESLEIFAPIANRLGIGQLKWELEDLSFRFLEPDTYRRIAKLLEEKREGRETYIQQVVNDIQSLLTAEGMHADVYGRPKHIYSIWSKMTHKHKQFTELFDVRAIRITVNTITECYTALGLIHGKWHHIAKEFDDYIANTKENGYQSLHTAVYGPEGKPVEVQIRTHAMHEFAEYGVAAHWRYKERGGQDEVLEKTISSVRKLLDTTENEEEELLDNFKTDLFSNRVFVLTPQGKVIDLPQGSTPLDFAYSIHTEIGHKCRGAKVNGHIVPLTSALKNGHQVEILTTNNAEPSRDWLNPNAGYLKSHRARSKVKAWFRQQDYEQNVIDGKSAIDRELRRVNLQNYDIEKLLKHFKAQTEEEWQAKVGRGDITTGQLFSAFTQLFQPESDNKQTTKAKFKRQNKKPTTSAVNVSGVGNLLTTMASCCKPVLGDDIIGFITQGKGVSVHRYDCHNILNLDADKQDHLIPVDWSDDTQQTFEVALMIQAVDRTGLLRDITNLLSDNKIHVVGFQTLSNKDTHTADIKVILDVNDLEQLHKISDRLLQLNNVLKVYRDN